MVVGLAMLLLSPFLVIFMLVYLFLRHAEQFYNHPSTASSRRWSNLSKWIFREFNEVSSPSISMVLNAAIYFKVNKLLFMDKYICPPLHEVASQAWFGCWPMTIAIAKWTFSRHLVFFLSWFLLVYCLQRTLTLFSLSISSICYAYHI